MAEGVCFEAFNLAALWRLPVLFVCENNHYAMGTALERYQANVDLVAKAEAQGVRGQRVDGMDVLAVREATRVALATLRDKRTPVFLECETYRFRAHSMYDPELYRAKEEVAQWRSRDPLLLFENAVQGRGLLSKEELSSIATEVTRELEEAAAFADDAPYEPPEQLHRGLVSTAQEDS
jgi:TPP-dependent pyruvate/acetoin dehydrogenase alpha subunit